MKGTPRLSLQLHARPAQWVIISGARRIQLACASRYKEPAGRHSRTLLLSSRRGAISGGAEAGLSVRGILEPRGGFLGKFSPLREI